MDITRIPVDNDIFYLGSQFGMCDTLSTIFADNRKSLIISVADKKLPCILRSTPTRFVFSMPWSIANGFNRKFLRARKFIFNIIDMAFAENMPVLVHCKRGHRRSVIIVTSYLMHRYNIDYTKAIQYVKSLRPSIKEQYVVPTLMMI